MLRKMRWEIVAFDVGISYMTQRGNRTYEISAT